MANAQTLPQKEQAVEFLCEACFNMVKAVYQTTYNLIAEIINSELEPKIELKGVHFLYPNELPIMAESVRIHYHDDQISQRFSPKTICVKGQFTTVFKALSFTTEDGRVFPITPNTVSMEDLMKVMKYLNIVYFEGKR